MCDRPLMTVTRVIRMTNSTETSWHDDNKVSTAGDHLAYVCVCGWRCILGRHGLWRHVESGCVCGGGIWVTVHCMCACAVSWDHTLDWLSHLLCDWTSPCSHVHLQTHTYIRTYSLGTHSGHLARPVRIFLHSVWPVDPRQPQASASQHATVAAPPLVLCCFTENLRICLVEKKLMVV